MADNGAPWDPEALERLLRLEADLASLLAFLAPRGPSGDNLDRSPCGSTAGRVLVPALVVYVLSNVDGPSTYPQPV